MNYTNFSINALVAATNNNHQQSNHQHLNSIGKTSSSNKLVTGISRQKCPPNTQNNLNLIKGPPVRPSMGYLNSTSSCATIGQFQAQSTQQARLHLRAPSNQQASFSGNHINNPSNIRTNQNAQASWNAPILDNANAGSVFLQNVQKNLPDTAYFHHHLQRPHPVSQLMVVGSPLVRGEIHCHEQQPVDMYQAAVSIHNSQHQQQPHKLKSQIEDVVHQRGVSNDDTEVDLSLQKGYQFSCAMKNEALDGGSNHRDNSHSKVSGNQNSCNDDNANSCNSNTSNNANDDIDVDEDDDEDDDDDDNGTRRRVRKTKIPKTVSGRKKDNLLFYKYLCVYI